MDFNLSDHQRHYLDRVTAFMDEHIYPAIATYNAEMYGHRRRALEGRPGGRGAEDEGQGRRPVELVHAAALGPDRTSTTPSSSKASSSPTSNTA